MKKVILLFLPLLLSCTAASNKRFSDFNLIAKDLSDVSIVADLLIGSDIDGPIPGIDVALHKEKNLLFLSSLQEDLEKKGYKPEVLVSSSGRFRPADVKMEFSEGMDGLGEFLDEPILKSGKEHLFSGNVSSFLTDSLLIARRYNKELAGNKSVSKNLAKLPQVPLSIRENSKNYLFLVSSTIKDVTVGEQLLTGVISSAAIFALSGGTVIYSMSSKPISIHEVAILDLNKAEVAWYNRFVGEGSKFIERDIVRTLRTLPGPNNWSVAKSYRVKNRNCAAPDSRCHGASNRN